MELKTNHINIKITLLLLSTVFAFSVNGQWKPNTITVTDSSKTYWTNSTYLTAGFVAPMGAWGKAPTATTMNGIAKSGNLGMGNGVNFQFGSVFYIQRKKPLPNNNFKIGINATFFDFTYMSYSDSKLKTSRVQRPVDYSIRGFYSFGMKLGVCGSYRIVRNIYADLYLNANPVWSGLGPLLNNEDETKNVTTGNYDQTLDTIIYFRPEPDGSVFTFNVRSTIGANIRFKALTLGIEYVFGGFKPNGYIKSYSKDAASGTTYSNLSSFSPSIRTNMFKVNMGLTFGGRKKYSKYKKVIPYPCYSHPNYVSYIDGEQTDYTMIDAIDRRDIVKVKYLLDYGADPNGNEQWRTLESPLMRACIKNKQQQNDTNNIPIIRLLVKYCASVNKETKDGKNALDYTNHNDTVTIEYLKKLGIGTSSYRIRQIEQHRADSIKREQYKADSIRVEALRKEQYRADSILKRQQFVLDSLKYAEGYARQANDVQQNTEEPAYRGGTGPMKGLNVNKPKEMVIGKYYALIIGIDNYQTPWAPLANAVNDAKAIEKILKTQYKFDVFTTLYNEQATRKTIIAELENLVNTVQSTDNVFIFYSGHGEYKKELDKGYWVPVDALTASTANYISNSDLQTYINGIKSKHTLLVSDACFSGDIFRGNTVSVPFEESERYYSEVHGLTSRQAITSGGIEPVMDGGRDGHSVFTYYFLKSLNENQSKYFDVSQIYTKIKIPVINNSEQTPRFSPIKNVGDEGGQFIFIRK